MIPLGLLLGYSGAGTFDQYQNNKKPYRIGFITSCILYAVCIGGAILT